MHVKHVQIHRHVPRNFALGRQKAEKVNVFSLARPAEGLQKVPATTRGTCQSIRDRAVTVQGTCGGRGHVNGGRCPWCCERGYYWPRRMCIRLRQAIGRAR